MPEFPSYPQCDKAVLRAVMEELKSGRWTRLEGAPELEAEWEAYLGGGHAWFLSSGTAALEALLLGHEIGPGDEVITTPYTWGASVAAILAIGAIPVFADIDPETAQIDPASVRKCIGPGTKAILAVHLFGIPSPVPELAHIASEAGIFLFEDASQAHGATLDGKKVGTFGDAAAFSCMGLKPLGATEGGLAVFREEDARERAYLYGRHPRGMDPARAAVMENNGLLDTLQLGWRPSALSAAILRARIPSLDRENAARRGNARHLRSLLRDLSGIRLAEEPGDGEAVYHLLSFTLHEEEAGFALEEGLRRLRGSGLPVFRYIPVPVHRMKRLNPSGYDGPRVHWHDWLTRYGVDYSETHCPVTEKRCACAFELAWNFIEEDPSAMEAIATSFHKAMDG